VVKDRVVISCATSATSKRAGDIMKKLYDDHRQAAATGDG
jgi:hypothetical protein